MNLNPQQQKIYDYLRDNGEATIVQLRNALFIAKPDMRISEMNRKHPNLIETKWKKKNGEHVKGLSRQPTKKQSTITIENGVAREVINTIEI